MKLFPTLLAVFILITAAALAAAADDSFSVTVPKMDNPPLVQGSIDESWSKAQQVSVSYDFTYQRSGEQTVAYIAQDASAIDVAFNVTQKDGVTANQVTNGPGVLNDDFVTVCLWPQGTQGFYYTFTANVHGARYQTSSENSSYSPEWTAVGHRTPTGYTVTMRIPLDIIRSGHSSTWKAQFERMTVASNSMQVWVHEPNQRNPADPTFAGTLEGIEATQSAAATKPKPRVQVYALGELTTPANGGNTSRMGADVALPVTATSSLLGSFHPDYSNVEIDQQTIAPSAYQRRYAEIRPFFTQAASFFNFNFSCTNCPTMLYTPSIPTYASGYAYEGTQGPLTFAAFNTQGTQRTDGAQTLNFNVSNPFDIYSVDLQRVAVNTPTLHDNTTSIDTGYLNQHTHYFVYFNGAEERGTTVTDPSLGNYTEYGGGYVTQLTTAGITLQQLGSQFSPADGFVAQSDIAGYLSFFNRTWNFSKNAALHDVSFNGSYGRYDDRFGNPAQTDGNLQFNLDFRNLMTLHLYTNSSGIETTFSNEFLPFNGNGFYLGYKTQTTTPTYVTYSGGLYYHGHLNAWSYVTTQPLRRSLNLQLELDESLYAPPNMSIEPIAQQWLERASLDWQMSRQASFDVGVRREIGRNLPNSFQAPDISPLFPCGTINGSNPFDCINAGNVSVAFHYLQARNEFYIVYGNPNSLATTPALYLKWIRYIGAGKGT